MMKIEKINLKSTCLEQFNLIPKKSETLKKDPKMQKGYCKFEDQHNFFSSPSICK